MVASPTSRSPTPRPPRDYFAPLFALARELDPTRPVGFVNMMLAPHGDVPARGAGDVLMLNRYYGWYVTPATWPPRRGLAEPSCRAGRRRASRSSSPSTARTRCRGLHSLTPEPWSEEYQEDYLRMNHRVFDSVDAVVGEHVWNFADFAHFGQRLPGRRQQEGRVHPGPPSQGGRTPAARTLDGDARVPLTGRGRFSPRGRRPRAPAPPRSLRRPRRRAPRAGPGPTSPRRRQRRRTPESPSRSDPRGGPA